MIRKETKIILENNFNINEQQKLISFGELLNKNNAYQNKLIQRKIWEYDQELMGLGGYACPLNPTMNPFNTMKEYRNVFRSLQYGRCDIFCLDRGRHTICDSGLHIETLAKILVSKTDIFSFVKNRNLLGKNVIKLRDKNIIDESLFIRILELIDLYNLAKHDTDENKNVTFSILDGVIFYFACRKIGNELLKILNHFSYNKKYKINEVTSWDKVFARECTLFDLMEVD